MSSLKRATIPNQLRSLAAHPRALRRGEHPARRHFSGGELSPTPEEPVPPGDGVAAAPAPVPSQPLLPSPITAGCALIAATATSPPVPPPQQNNGNSPFPLPPSSSLLSSTAANATSASSTAVRTRSVPGCRSRKCEPLARGMPRIASHARTSSAAPTYEAIPLSRWMCPHATSPAAAAAVAASTMSIAASRKPCTARWRIGTEYSASNARSITSPPPVSPITRASSRRSELMGIPFAMASSAPAALKRAMSADESLAVFMRTLPRYPSARSRGISSVP
mmetsp:Transcript_43970/g.145660  ORF Transcript_43970/g.145660 Transcript_43970/m.145660 type:complete len:279 (-) Transcript_43970:1267-2103(-)